MKKRIFALAVAIMVTNLSAVSFATTVTPVPQNAERQEVYSESVSPRADVLVYHYRDYNGKLQRRLWNQTKGYWMEEFWTTISIH